MSTQQAYTWTNDNEINFIRGLDRLQLQGYLQGLERRQVWDRIDKAACRAFAGRQLAEQEGRK